METRSLLLLGLWPFWGNSLFPQEQLTFASALSFAYETTSALGCSRAQVRKTGLFAIWTQTMESL